MGLLCLAFTLATLCQTLSAQLSTDQWREDVQLLATDLPNHHPNLTKTPRAEFDRAVAALNSGLADMTSSQIVVALAQLVAMGADGHTSLALTQTAANLRAYPLQLYWFQEGIYAIGGSPATAAVLGKRLRTIGTRQSKMRSPPLLRRSRATTTSGCASGLHLISYWRNCWLRSALCPRRTAQGSRSTTATEQRCPSIGIRSGSGRA